MKKHEILLALIESSIDCIKTGEIETNDDENIIAILTEILNDYEIELEQITLKKS